MQTTKKSITDDIMNIMSKFNLNDDSRLDVDWLSYKIDQVRAELIVKEYDTTKFIDNAWLSDLGLVDFHKVNFADDLTASYCKCDISKAHIPQLITLYNPNGNIDMGVYTVISACGKTRYFNKPLSLWNYTPEGHVHNLFRYFHRNNTALYVNHVVDQLRIICLLAQPEEGIIINSEPVASGSITVGTVYYVKYKQIVYNGVTYQPGSTFTGVTGKTTYTGSGTVYLNSQIHNLRETEAYPVTPDMARAIVLEIITKEFGLEKAVIPDTINDSEDEAQKGQG
jgi:hypothetical protein